MENSPIRTRFHIVKGADSGQGADFGQGQGSDYVYCVRPLNLSKHILNNVAGNNPPWDMWNYGQKLVKRETDGDNQIEDLNMRHGLKSTLRIQRKSNPTMTLTKTKDRLKIKDAIGIHVNF